MKQVLTDKEIQIEDWIFRLACNSIHWVEACKLDYMVMVVGSSSTIRRTPFAYLAAIDRCWTGRNRYLGGQQNEMIEWYGLLVAIVAAWFFSEHNQDMRAAMYLKYVDACTFLGECFRRFL